MFDDQPGSYSDTSSAGTSTPAPVAISFRKSHERKTKARQSRLKQLEDGITELAAHMDAALFRWLELVREFDECNGWTGDGLKSCAHWLNWKCGLNLGAARERVRVAHALPGLPKTRELFRQGRISFSKVRAITRVATPRNEDMLLNIAVHGTAWHVERAVSAWRRELRLQALQRDKLRHDQRELHWRWDDEGYLVVQGRLTPEQGAVFQQAIETAAQQLFEEQKHVSAEISDENSGPHFVAKPHPMASRRADALLRLAEGWLSGKPATNGNAVVVNLHSDIATLKTMGEGAESTLECGTETVAHVSAETSRRIACDAGVIHWLEHHSGTGRPETLNVGRKSRTVSPALRRALQRRDRGCRFPGCNSTHYADAHHIVHWADGGETNLENLVLLCRAHHRLLHEGGFKLLKSAGNRFQFINPQGREIPETSNSRFRGACVKTPLLMG
jgi:hypothetical protein